MTVLEPTTQTGRAGQTALRLGVRAHDFGCMPAGELAARVAAGGFSCVQLVLNKAVAGLNLQTGDLNAMLAREIGGAFRQQGVTIAVLGCYINPIHPDLKTRAARLQFFNDHLRFARDFGCGLVALESGSVNADYSPHPANQTEEAFTAMLASLAELVAEAERFGVNVGLEAVTSHTVSTPAKMRRALDAIGSKHLQVVYDPVNLLTADNCREQERVAVEALDLFGDRVAAIHAKDFVLENGALRTVPAGRGRLNYAPVMRFVRHCRPEISVLLEEAGGEAAHESAQFMQRKYDEE
jgi:L-ribulose-5-phosphate 3-epimerase